MRYRLVPTLILAIVLAAAILAAVVATPAHATPRASACTNCHPAAPSSATVSATPSTATPAPGASYNVTINLAGLTASGDTGYWIANGVGTPAVSVYAGNTGTNQTSYTRAMTAPAAAGTYTYTVWTDKGGTGSGQAKSTTYSITVSAPAPATTISALTPNHARTGAAVVIAGANLGTSGTVKFGATTAATTAWSATSVTATVPASLATGATTVTVTPTGGAASNGLAFTVEAPPAPATPVLSSLVPNSGIVGSSLVITGSNLGTSGAVTVGGVAATTSAWSATSITCKVPASLTTGAKSVVVTPTGAAASNALTYTVTLPAPAAPSIAGLTPNHALAGAQVVIAGANLGTSGTVKFGATTAATTAWSATSVTATVPAGFAAGATTVTVTPAGAAVSNGLAFTVDAPAPPSTGDTTAPVTTAGGSVNHRWYNHSVTVLLQALDNAGGSGVKSVTYQIDDGAPVTVAGASASAYVQADPNTHGRDGSHTVTYFATDLSGNVEAAQIWHVNIDTRKPSTKAPSATTVRRSKTATLHYAVSDGAPNGKRVAATIVVKNSRGAVVKTITRNGAPVNTALTASFTCTLRVGVYTFSVKATDRAGNTQANIATQKLTVLSAQ